MLCVLPKSLARTVLEVWVKDIIDLSALDVAFTHKKSRAAFLLLLGELENFWDEDCEITGPFPNFLEWLHLRNLKMRVLNVPGHMIKAMHSVRAFELPHVRELFIYYDESCEEEEDSHENSKNSAESTSHSASSGEFAVDSHKYMKSFLLRLPSLTKLENEGEWMLDSGDVKAITEAKHLKLASLDPGCLLEDVEPQHILHLLESFSSSLRSLSLPEELPITSSFLRALPPLCPHLSSLELYVTDQTAPQQLVAMCAALGRLRSLSLLEAASNAAPLLSDQLVASLAAHCPSVRRWKVDCSFKITPNVGIKAIFQHCKDIELIDTRLWSLTKIKHTHNINSMTTSNKNNTDPRDKDHDDHNTSNNNHKKDHDRDSFSYDNGKDADNDQDIDKAVDADDPEGESAGPQPLYKLAFYASNLTLAEESRLVDEVLKVVPLALDSIRSLSYDFKASELKTIWTRFGSTLSSLIIGVEGKTASNMYTQLVLHCPQLSLLSLKYCKHLQDISLLSLARRCATLKTLHLGGAAEITDEGLGEVLKHCPLSSLQLAGCVKISDVTLENILLHAKQLRILGIGHNMTGLTALHLREFMRRTKRHMEMALHTDYEVDLLLLLRSMGSEGMRWIRTVQFLNSSRVMGGI